VEVLGTHEQGWQAVLKPVHVFPHVDADGVYLSSERRLYDDVVILDSAGRTTAVSGPSQPTQAFGFESPYPNPFNATVLLRFRLAAEAQVRVDVYDSVGQRVRRLVDERMDGGTHAVEWDATDAAGATVASGVYLFDLRAGSARDTVEAALLR
jgi:hypothetical protein